MAIELSKKDKILLGIAGGLLLIVVIVYAISTFGGQGDKVTPETVDAAKRPMGVPDNKR